MFAGVQKNSPKKDQAGIPDLNNMNGGIVFQEAWNDKLSCSSRCLLPRLRASKPRG